MGHAGIAVFLVPWDKDGVPDKRILFSDIFHFHPAVWEHGLDSYIQESEDERENCFTLIVVILVKIKCV